MNHQHKDTQQQELSREFLLQMLNGISDPIFVKNRQHRWVVLNDALCNFIGYSREELIGKSDYDFFPKAEADVFWEKDELVFTTGVTNQSKEHFTDAAGINHVIYTKKFLFADESGNKFIVGTIQDITEYQQIEVELEKRVEKRTEELAQTNQLLLQKVVEHQQTEVALRQSEAKLQKLAANVPGMLYEFMLQPDGSVSFPYVSSGCYEIYELTSEQMQADAHSMISRIHQDDRQNFEQSVAVSAQTLQPWQWEGQMILSSGKLKWVKALSRPEKQANGAILWHGVLLEISDRIQAEKSLKENERKYRQLVETSQDMIWSVNVQGHFTFVNGAARHIYGYEPEEMINRSFKDFIAPEQAEKDEQMHPRLLAGESIFQYETVHIGASGKRINLLFNAIALQDEAGNIIGTTGTASNITERKQAEKEQARLVAIIEGTSDYVAIANADGYFIYMNSAGRRMLGISIDEDITKIHFSQNHPSRVVNGTLLKEMQTLLKNNIWRGETYLLARDRTEIPISQVVRIHRNESGEIEFNSVIARDISEQQAALRERKQAELALRRSNALLKAQQEAAIDGILIVDENLEVISYNKRFSEIWQIPLEIVEAGDDRQVLPLAVEKTANPEKFLAKVQYLYQHPQLSSRDEVILKDGRTLDRYSAPVRSPSGDYYGRIWSFRDISDRKQAETVLRQSEAQLRVQTQELEKALHELQRTQSQLIQSEKMSSLGQLVAGVAHEINNPVNFIFGNLAHASGYIEDLLQLLQLYQQNYPQPMPEIADFAKLIELDFLQSDLPQLLNSMKVGADRIREIVLSLRTFSRLDEAEMKAVDIHQGIDSTLMILQSRLKANGERQEIQVIKEYSDLPLVECYAGQLNQVFMNILANAIDALEEGIGTREWGLSSIPAIRICTEVVATNQVTIRIADNGLGMPEAVKQRLFDPFFTTKPVGKGTGMGLSISYQIVSEKHGGCLECLSESGKGTEFLITIPLIQQGKISNL